MRKSTETKLEIITGSFAACVGAIYMGGGTALTLLSGKIPSLESNIGYFSIMVGSYFVFDQILNIPHYLGIERNPSINLNDNKN